MIAVMEETFFRTHSYLIENTNVPVRRSLMDEIDWGSRLIGIKGTRGVGKTSFLLQYAKEHFDTTDHRCLYVNMNNFYFQEHGLTELADDFVKQGGKVLLIDQIFKQPDWSSELLRCYEMYPSLKIIFTGSSVMRLKEGNPTLSGIVSSHNLRGFSFREFLNLKTNNAFHSYTLQDILANHEQIVKQILPKVSPQKYFNEYLHHGFYPFFLEHRNFSENLLKTMNMMIEVDILLIKQIELKYLTKIKKLFYMLAINGLKTPNISKLADEIQTSRATVMNYIKNLAEARLINIIYPVGQSFPKKPSKIMMQNTNIMFAILPMLSSMQDLMETFFVNTLWKDHKVNKGNKDHLYVIDRSKKMCVCDANNTDRAKYGQDVIYTRYNTEIGRGNQIPLWLFGFLY